MGWLVLIKTIATVIAVLLAAEWVFKTFYLELRRDFKELAVQEQSNITSTRKENETALYRNFLIPMGFPLVTGLGLSLKYKIRNGNFADVWNAVMELADENAIKFIDKPKGISLDVINGISKHILETHLSKIDGNVGIVVAPSKSPGFIMAIATMMASVKYNTLPHFLTSLPREKLEGIDILLVDSWESYARLSGSENWYSMIIVCEPGSATSADIKNVISWDQFIAGYTEDKIYAYAPPEDNSDDNKTLLLSTSPWNQTTSFGQRCLVSSIASFIRSFPIDHEITGKDVLTVAGSFAGTNYSLQVWQKVLAVLLHGGSITFEEKVDLRVLHQTSLLLVYSEDLMVVVEDTAAKNYSYLGQLKFQWATALLSEGVFTKLGQLPSKAINRLRCIFLAEQVQDSALVASFLKTIPKLKKGKPLRSVTTLQLNNVRARLGSRVILEYYCPYNVIGPIAHTNFYDYRVLPQKVGDDFTFCGPLSLSLEGKFVRTIQNPELDIAKKQGMLCIRGFTIGKPVELTRLESAQELSSNFGGGEGWMPMVGIFGLWGKDGCLYVYN